MNLGPFPLVDFSDCDDESDTGYKCDCALNDGHVDVLDDRKSCRAFCYSNHPNANFFTHEKEGKCWCKKATAGNRPEGKREKEGATSGEIKCGGKIVDLTVL